GENESKARSEIPLLRLLTGTRSAGFPSGFRCLGRGARPPRARPTARPPPGGPIRLKASLRVPIIAIAPSSLGFAPGGTTWPDASVSPSRHSRSRRPRPPPPAPDPANPRLLSMPAIPAKHIAFISAEDLWVADRDGKTPRRLTSDIGVESDPAFSPDGSLLAFSAQYDGNTDVYTIPVTGGTPQRLTYHPRP